MKKTIVCLLASLLFSGYVSAQSLALKTNCLSDVTLSPDLGVEFPFAEKWTADISGSLNFWNITDDTKWKHWRIQPEARYWLCDKFAGSFVGAHLIGGQYNIGGISNGVKFLGTDFSMLTDNRYQGWFMGAGLAYGYAFALNRHWNLELEAGAGYIFANYQRFECMDCGRKMDMGTHNYFGLTKAAVNFVYVF